MEKIIVAFDIPYYLELEDSISGNEDWRFKVTYNSVESEFRFKKQVLEQAPNGMKFRGDRNGKYWNTKVEVHLNDIFYEAIPSKEHSTNGDEIIFGLPDEYSKYLLGWTIDFLNELLEIYRIFTNKFWIKHLGLADIVEFNVTEMYDDGTLASSKYFVGLEEIDDRKVDTEMRDAMKEFLAEDQSLNLVKYIDLDIQDEIARRDFEMAILNCSRLFEVWLKLAYIEIMDDRGRKSKKEAARICRDTPTGSFMEETFYAHTGFDLEGCTEYSNWETQVWEVRGGIIHGNRLAEHDEARQAYETTKKLIARILDEFESELEGSSVHAIVDYPS